MLGEYNAIGIELFNKVKHSFRNHPTDVFGIFDPGKSDHCPVFFVNIANQIEDMKVLVDNMLNKSPNILSLLDTRTNHK